MVFNSIVKDQKKKTRKIIFKKVPKFELPDEIFLGRRKSWKLDGECEERRERTMSNKHAQYSQIFYWEMCQIIVFRVFVKKMVHIYSLLVYVFYVIFCYLSCT